MLVLFLLSSFLTFFKFNLTKHELRKLRTHKQQLRVSFVLFTAVKQCFLLPPYFQIWRKIYVELCLSRSCLPSFLGQCQPLPFGLNINLRIGVAAVVPEELWFFGSKFQEVFVTWGISNASVRGSHLFPRSVTNLGRSQYFFNFSHIFAGYSVKFF